MTASPDRIRTQRSHCTAMVALDTVDALVERVLNLLSHNRRMTLATRYGGRDETPEVHAGLRPSEPPTRWRDGNGVGVHLDRPGRLTGFSFGALPGVNDVEADEWKRFHAGDRVEMTQVEITGGIGKSGPGADDRIVIRRWNSNGVESETVIVFDPGTDDEQLGGAR